MESSLKATLKRSVKSVKRFATSGKANGSASARLHSKREHADGHVDMELSSVNGPRRTKSSAHARWPHGTSCSEVDVSDSGDHSGDHRSSYHQGRASAGAGKSILWRGMRDIHADNGFMSRGGAELAPCSTTEELEVAAQYARGGESTTEALLFRITVTSPLQRGADLMFLSAFPHEREVLYPPLTYFQSSASSRPRTFKHDGMVITVIDVEPHFPSL